MLVGCARVSTLDQNLDLQRDALTKAGCERIFEEKKSGKAGAKRPEFEAALAYLGSSAAGVASLCCLHRRSLYNDGSHTPPRVGGSRSF
jgi:DNA invertase Pin-like site-specific DNA recombinase